ncbi:AlpA family transcriptional regulator [Azoarcus sp. PA01]|nr:AlpA family transcriptional regulator [Azoarcus sp. PA01]
MNNQHGQAWALLTQMGVAPDVIIRERERRAITKVCRTAWWEWEKQGVVPKRVQLGARSVGWRLSELQAWIRGEWRATSGAEG